MTGQLVLRFLIGGSVVSLFAAISEVVKPRTFSGLFGAAPSVALATLALTYNSDGASAVAIAARWMAIGAIALFVYAALCVRACGSATMPVWLGAVLAWFAWLAIAVALFAMLDGTLAT